MDTIRSLNGRKITEVFGLEGDVVTLQDLFITRGVDDEGYANSRSTLLGPLRSTGLRPKFLDKMEHSNVHVDPMLFAMEGLR